MRVGHWDETKTMPWEYIKKQWMKEWDLDKPVLLEKSPPNIMRAREIEKCFKPSYFISINRNPYAFCEGYSRRRDKPYEIAAQWWIRFSKYQIKNIANLKYNLFFKYEDLIENKKNIAKQISDFMPKLSDIDVNGKYFARTVGSPDFSENPIMDYNAEKIKKLTSKDILVINTVLKRNLEILRFFNYELS